MFEDHPERLPALERQLRLGWPQLRFVPELEPSFRQQYRIWVTPFRLTLIVIAALLIAVTPLLDILLLHPPQAFMTPAHAVQLGVMLPALVLAWACTRSRRLAGWADAASLLAVSVVAGGLLYQRHLGAQFQVWVPTELITVTVAGAYVMGGLGFWRMTPLAALLLVSIAVVEVTSYGNNATTQYIIFGVTTQILIAGLAGYLQEHFARGTWLREQLLEILAAQDSLTGLLNFRAFEQRYQPLFSRAARERKPLLVALLDLDFFKQYNDAYGHAAGNTCLRRIADHVASNFRRDADIQARMGGEEFVLVLYDLSQADAERTLERLRADIEALALPHQRSALPGRVVTISIGARWCLPHTGLAADAILQEADRCMYQAKDLGRNRMVFSGQSLNAPEPAAATA